MTAYLLRRLGTSIIVVLGISIFIFVLLHAIYPSPARDVLGLKSNNLQIAAWNKQHGFSRPDIIYGLKFTETAAAPVSGALIKKRPGHDEAGYSFIPR